MSCIAYPLVRSLSRGVGESPGFYERNDDVDDVASLAFGRQKTQLRMQLHGRICNRDCTKNRMAEGTNVARHIPVDRHHRSFKFVEETRSLDSEKNSRREEKRRFPL